jgi:hypothetical protein
MSTVQQAAPAVCPDGAHMGEHACTNRSQCWEPCGELGHSEEHAQAIHPDDEAVDRFAAVLKDKLTVARAKGRGGWQDKAEVTADELTDMLVGHLWKGDPRDVANFCMFLWERGERITLADNPRMERAAEAFGIAEAKCAERHAAAGRLIAPSISTEAGLLAAAPYLVSRSSPPTADGEQAKQALRKVLGVLHRYLEPNGISKYDALNEILGIVDSVPLVAADIEEGGEA